MKCDRASLTQPQSRALHMAEAALHSAYSPFSGIQVAAALVLPDREPVVGTNYESASYGLTLCAERAAIAAAQSADLAESIQSLVLVARDNSRNCGLLLTPCGACRQWIVELAERCHRDFTVYCFAAGGEHGRQFTAKGLLPDNFALPTDL